MNARLAGAVARQALALARSGVTPEAAAPLITRATENDVVVLELARSRVLAAFYAEPTNPHVERALAILSESLRHHR